MGAAKTRRDWFVMIDALFSDSTYLSAKKMLDVSAMRQEAIASNLANIETPNYKRLDVSPTFESQLSQAVASGESTQINGLQPQLAVDTQALSGRSDGNNVELDQELLKLNQNTVEHALETQMVNSLMTRMRMAVTGKS
jgi:flagellar basal-body rod protein FlgB